MVFPPTSLYPKFIDSDYTLYLVHNTTESRTCVENAAWANEVVIVPVAADAADIWADNGFANISGELFYYDSVEKNGDGKVVKLKGCARNLGGKATRHNPAGTWVRSFVVAEHHNRLAESILNTENFIGSNFDEREETLDWRIRNLQQLDVIFDDAACPEVNFTFNTLEDDSARGILTEYVIDITTSGSTGNFSFKLDFGDGTSTTTTLAGQHRYSINARIDPVLTVTNNLCQLILTPTIRSNPSEPPEVISNLFDIPIPEVPEVPDFIFVPCEVPEPDINLPPLVPPCGEGGIEVPSYVLIEVTNPIVIPGSIIEIIGPDIPSVIIGPDIPPTIVIDPPIPPTIIIIPPSSLALDMSTPMSIDWTSMPKMDLNVVLPKRAKINPMAQMGIDEFGDEFADLFDIPTEVEYEEVGIPEEIKIIAPQMPKIEFDMSTLPRSIKLEADDVHIPTDIQIHGPESPIPTEIFLRSEVPTEIRLVSDSVIPEKIEVLIPEEFRNIPEKIVVEMPNPIPDRITVEGIPDSLKVTGIPDHIEIKGFPDFIPLKLPDDPFIEMRYKGDPIKVQIDLQPLMTPTEGEKKGPCVMLVPCS